MKFSEFKRKIGSLPLFSSSMLNALAGTEELGTMKLQLSLWKKRGLVQSLRRGLYVLGPEERKQEPSRFYLANQMRIPSYISMESALAYYGLIPEFVAATTSVTVRKTAHFENDLGVFIYQHVQPEGYTGYQAVDNSNGPVILLARPEKAIVDFLYLNLSTFDPSDRSIFEESYRFQNCESLNRRLLKGYAKKLASKKLDKVVDSFIQALLVH